MGADVEKKVVLELTEEEKKWLINKCLTLLTTKDNTTTSVRDMVKNDK